MALEIAPPESSSRATENAQRKTWKAGTLTYTSAGLATLFLWLLGGDFAWSMRDRSVGPMAVWYLEQLKASNFLLGLLVSSFPALISLFLGPVISVKSDRHRGKRGRRIPYLLVTTPIAAVGMFGLGLTPVIAGWMHGVLGQGHPFGLWLHGALEGTPSGAWIVSWLQNETMVSLVCFGVFWTAFEFASIAGHIVLGGLINDVVPKPLLGRFHGLFRAVSLIDGILFNYWIMGRVPRHYTFIFCAIGLFYSVGFLWMCFKVKEGDYPPVEPSNLESRCRFGVAASIRTYFRECFTDRYYLSVFGMTTIAVLAFTPVNTFSIPYARSLEMSMDFYGKCSAFIFLVSLGLSYPLGWLSDVFHPIRVSMASLAGYFAVTLFGWFFATTPDRFAVAFILHGVLSGCYFTSSASLGQRLYPHSKYAQFGSAGGMIRSLCTMGLGPVVGIVIDSTGSIYRHTFLIGSSLTFAALAASFYVHARFMRLGGPGAYVAPGE